MSNEGAVFCMDEMGEAIELAKSRDLPLWDTHCTPDRWVVGWLGDEDEDFENYTQIFV